MADVAPPILSLATALPLAHSVAGTAVPTIDSACGIPEHTRDPHPEELKMVTSGEDINQDPDTKEAGCNI